MKDFRFSLIDLMKQPLTRKKSPWQAADLQSKFLQKKLDMTEANKHRRKHGLTSSFQGKEIFFTLEKNMKELIIMTKKMDSYNGIRKE